MWKLDFEGMVLDEAYIGPRDSKGVGVYLSLPCLYWEKQGGCSADALRDKDKEGNVKQQP